MFASETVTTIDHERLERECEQLGDELSRLTNRVEKQKIDIRRAIEATYDLEASLEDRGISSEQPRRSGEA